MKRPDRLFPGYVFDLDGTVYLGDALLPTAGETVMRLRALGCRTVFLSNNPTHPPDDYAAKLSRLGLPTDVGDILVSTQVLVHFLQERMPGARIFVIGEAPLVEALAAAGFEIAEEAADRRGDCQLRPDVRLPEAPGRLRRDPGRRPVLRHQRRPLLPRAGRQPARRGGRHRGPSRHATGVACEAIVGKPSRHTGGRSWQCSGCAAGCLMTGDRLRDRRSDGPRRRHVHGDRPDRRDRGDGGGIDDRADLRPRPAGRATPRSDSHGQLPPRRGPGHRQEPGARARRPGRSPRLRVSAARAALPCGRSRRAGPAGGGRGASGRRSRKRWSGPGSPQRTSRRAGSHRGGAPISCGMRARVFPCRTPSPGRICTPSHSSASCAGGVASRSAAHVSANGPAPGALRAPSHVADGERPVVAEAAREGGLRAGLSALWVLNALGRADGHRADVSLAQSMTLYDFRAREYWADWLAYLNVPRAALPDVTGTVDDFGWLEIDATRVPVRAMIGDQQAALFGYDCRAIGDAECTHGTASFVDVSRRGGPGARYDQGVPRLAAGQPSTYCLEADDSHRRRPVVARRGQDHRPRRGRGGLAGSVSDAGGVVFVPAFTGLNVPYDVGKRGDRCWA